MPNVNINKAGSIHIGQVIAKIAAIAFLLPICMLAPVPF